MMPIFIDNDLNKLENLLPVCTDVLKDWDLNVNESKTEFVRFYLALRGDVDSDGVPLVDRR